MKILFLMRNVGYVRNFDTAMHAVLARGHQIEIALEQNKRSPNELPAYERLDAILAAQSGASLSDRAPSKKVQRPALDEVQAVRDYLRYLDPSFGQSPDLQERARRRLKGGWQGPVSWAEKSERNRQRLDRVLKVLEAGAPANRGAENWLEERKPDLLCVTPLVSLGSVQSEYLRAARRLNIPTALCVASWDNLTNKGLVHGDPDSIIVWNEAQKAEAVQMHEQPADTVHVVGAHSYDHWFDWQPSKPRDAFLEEAGLRTDRRVILYLCSSPFIAPNEIDFLENWLAALRASDDPELSGACVLIRPHPQNTQPWERLDRFMDGSVCVYPRQGDNPVGQRGREIYYDSLHTGEVVVGINTSGLIEAGILGNAVYTVRDPEHAARQEGTVHFHLLQEVGGGLLKLASDLPSHMSDLSGALANPADGATRAKGVVSQFVRPKGLEKPAAPLFADALEATERAGPRPVKQGAMARLAWRIAAPRLERPARRDSPEAKGSKAKGSSLEDNG